MITVDFKENELATYRSNELAVLMMRMKMRSAGVPLIEWKATNEFPFEVTEGVLTFIKCHECHGLHVTYLTVDEYIERLGGMLDDES